MALSTLLLLIGTLQGLAGQLGITVRQGVAGVGLHRAQDVVELVGDQRGDGAQVGELLRLAHLHLELGDLLLEQGEVLFQGGDGAGAGAGSLTLADGRRMKHIYCP